MRSNEKGHLFITVLGVLTGLLILYLLSFVAIRNDQERKLKKYFSIEIPESNEFTAAEITFLRPVVEKELQKYYNNLQNAQIAIDKIRKTRGEITIDDANESLENLRRAQISEKHARYNLAKACGAAKYFKLVSEDCEPCKAVK